MEVVSERSLATVRRDSDTGLIQLIGSMITELIRDVNRLTGKYQQPIKLEIFNWVTKKDGSPYCHQLLSSLSPASMQFLGTIGPPAKHTLNGVSLAGR